MQTQSCDLGNAVPTPVISEIQSWFRDIKKFNPVSVVEEMWSRFRDIWNEVPIPVISEMQSRKCSPNSRDLGTAVLEMQSWKYSLGNAVPDPVSMFPCSIFLIFFFFSLNSEIFCGCGCVQDRNWNPVLLNPSPGPWRHQVRFRNSLKIDRKFH